MIEERRVAIVGAGAAGLACAQLLSHHGVEPVVLEARDRVGGRAVTDYEFSPGQSLELGALMIHGRRVVTQEWVRELGLSRRPFLALSRTRLTVNGRVVRFPSVMRPFHPDGGLRATYQALVQVPRELARAVPPDRSLAEFLEGRPLSPLARTIGVILHAHVYAADPDQIGIAGPAEESRAASEPFGYRNYALLEGYSELMRRRFAGLASTVRLGCRVQEINWSEEGVELRGLEGTTERPFRLRARTAVLTVPLGVLKSGEPNFDPPLPEEKRRAISELAFGQAIVVHLALRESELPERLGEFDIFGNGTPSTFLRYPARSGSLHRRWVLSAFTTGRAAERRSRASDEDVVEETVGELEELLPRRARVGSVEGTRIQRWPSERWTRGAYSFLPVGGRLALRTRLAAPVGNVLFFAGEATHDRGESATVHGAIESGYRAAREILAVAVGSGAGSRDAARPSGNLRG